jgi:hypothetical protein
MADSGSVNLNVRHWTAFMVITLVLHGKCILLAPLYAFGCPCIEWQVLVVLSVPVAWAIVLVAVHRGRTGRCLAGGVSVASAVFVYLVVGVLYVLWSVLSSLPLIHRSGAGYAWGGLDSWSY